MTRIYPALLLLGALASPSWADDPLPPPVVRFLERRAVCDNWRFEPQISPERTATVSETLCRYCAGTDAELARLKRQYAQEPRLVAELRPIEEGIEPKLMNGKLECPTSGEANPAGR